MSDGMTDKRSKSETVLRTNEVEEFINNFRPKVLSLLLSCEGVEHMTVKQLKDLTDKIETATWSSIRGIKR